MITEEAQRKIQDNDSKHATERQRRALHVGKVCLLRIGVRC